MTEWVEANTHLIRECIGIVRYELGDTGRADRALVELAALRERLAKMEALVREMERPTLPSVEEHDRWCRHARQLIGEGEAP